MFGGDESPANCYGGQHVAMVVEPTSASKGRQCLNGRAANALAAALLGAHCLGCAQGAIHAD